MQVGAVTFSGAAVAMLGGASKAIAAGSNDDASQQDIRILNTAIAAEHEDELPVIFRAVFMLRAIDQCSVQTTAEILEVPAATVKTRYCRARKLMQQRLMDFSSDSGVAIHEFAGHRCDAIVKNVLPRLESPIDFL